MIEQQWETQRRKLQRQLLKLRRDNILLVSHLIWRQKYQTLDFKLRRDLKRILQLKQVKSRLLVSERQLVQDEILMIKAINRDSFDPQLGAALRSIGPVRPSPTQSNSSTVQAQPAFDNGLGGDQPVFPDPRNNPALIVLDARKRYGELAESEINQYGRKGFQGKQLLDIQTIRQILVMRERQGINDAEIEEDLEIYPGVIGKLGKGVFSLPDTTGVRKEN